MSMFWSEALDAHYKSHYPFIETEKARLSALFEVSEIAAFPESFSPHPNDTRFHHLLCRAVA